MRLSQYVILALGSHTHTHILITFILYTGTCDGALCYNMQMQDLLITQPVHN